MSVAAVVLFASCGGSDRSRSGREASRYSHRMHNRFYEAWLPPPTLTAPRGKISIPVDVSIDENGRVRRFNIMKSCGHPEIDASVREVGRRVKRVAPPPETAENGRFNLRVFFELDVKR